MNYTWRRQEGPQREAGAEDAGVFFINGIYRNRTSPSQSQEASQRPACSNIQDPRIVLKKIHTHTSNCYIVFVWVLFLGRTA